MAESIQNYPLSTDLATQVELDGAISSMDSISSDILDGLSNVINEKLSTIADLVEEETKKLDELSTKVDSGSSSSISDYISAITINGTTKTPVDKVVDLGTVGAEGYLPLSGGMISSNFALSAADRYGSGSYNFLSGVTGDLAFGLGSSATGAGAEAIGTGAVAKGHESFATGRGAQVQNEYNVDCIAVGFNAVVNVGSSYADGGNAIQLGYGTNTTPHTMQVFTHTLMDTATGDIPYARLSANLSAANFTPLSATQELSSTIGDILSILQEINGTGDGDGGEQYSGYIPTSDPLYYKVTKNGTSVSRQIQGPPLSWFQTNTDATAAYSDNGTFKFSFDGNGHIIVTVDSGINSAYSGGTAPYSVGDTVATIDQTTLIPTSTNGTFEWIESL